MTAENKNIAVGLEWKRVKESLDAAQTLFKAKLYRDSVSRSYYAIFHAAVAALLTKGQEARSHKGVNSLFSLHFVQTGKIDRKHIRLFSKIQKFREEADYEPEIGFSDEDAEESLADAELFCQEIEKFLKSEHYDI